MLYLKNTILMQECVTIFKIAEKTGAYPMKDSTRILLTYFNSLRGNRLITDIKM